MIRNKIHEQEEEQHPPNIENTSLPLDEINHASNVDNSVPLPIPPSSSEDENDERNEIIRSPLDQRLYKSITLNNGLRAMLISTYKVQSFPEEQDATKAACQIPEVAEFNKMYMGYDNPAARVKCACPCDENKACCCGPAKESTASNEEKCKNTLKDIGSIKAACCSKNTANSSGAKRPSSKKKVPKNSPKPTKNRTENMEAYLAKISTELRTREIQAKRFNALRLVKKKIPIQVRGEVTLNKIETIASSQRQSTDKLNEKSSEESLHSRDMQHHHNSALRNYPHPPKCYEGLQTNRTCPIETSHRQSRRASVTTDVTPELDGTVYLVIGRKLL